MESAKEIAARFAAKKGNLMLDLYPVTKLTFALCMLLASICSPHWCFGFIVFVACGILTACAGKLKEYLKGMRIILILFVGLLTIVRSFFYTGENLHYFLQLGRFHMSWEGAFAGLGMGSIVLAIASPLLMTTNTTTVEDIVIALEHIGLSPTGSFLVLSTFQMVPELRARSTVIQDSQKSRSIEVEGSLLVRAKAFFPMITPLVLSSFAATEEKSVALESRGFNYKCAKTRVRVITDTPAQKRGRIIMAILTGIFCVAGGYFKWFA